MTGRGRTCDAPRFKRALYLAELRSREEWAEPGSNRRPPPHQRGALPTALSAVDVACLSNPRRGARRTRGRWDTLRSSRIGTLAVSPTNLSMPLAYPSTLDRRPGAQRPTWRGVGAPVLASCHCELACESNTYIHTRNTAPHRRGPFSLKRGLKYESNVSS